jgi:hypothetical protein
MMGRIKKTTTIRIEAPNEFSVADLREFLTQIPETAKIRVKQSSSYPGEQGSDPAYMEATWTE